MTDFLEQFIDFWNTYQPLRSLGLAAVTFIIGRWVAKYLTHWVTRLMKRAEIEQTVITFVGHFCYITLIILTTLIALRRLGIETTSLLAVLGAAGLAIGLALQGSLSNLAAGILLVVFRPFKQGDFIDAGGILGTVKEIQILTTVMDTPENLQQIVPNAKLTSDVITNYSAHDTRRVDLTFDVSYDDDLKQVKTLLLDLLAEDPCVLEEPEPFVAVSVLGDNGITFVVRAWVNRPDFRTVRFGLPEQVKLAFDQHGITIPYPQQTIRVAEGRLYGGQQHGQ